MESGRRTLLTYLAAAGVYIPLGVFFPRTVLSFAEGTAFLLLAVWVVPAIWDRLRR